MATIQNGFVFNKTELCYETGSPLPGRGRSEKEIRIARATANKQIPSIEQILHTLKCMPSVTEINLRNRAVISLCLLTGARDGAMTSLKLKHIDVVEGKLVQDARQVKTKFSKTFTTWFFPVPSEVRQIGLANGSSS